MVLRPRRDVVEIDRRRHLVRDRREVPHQAVLRAGDEERRDHRDPVHPESCEVAREQHRLERRRHPGIDDHPRPRPPTSSTTSPQQPHLLLKGERGEVAVRPGAHDVVARLHLAANLGACGVIVHRLVVVEAGDERDESFLLSMSVRSLVDFQDVRFREVDRIPVEEPPDPGAPPSPRPAGRPAARHAPEAPCRGPAARRSPAPRPAPPAAPRAPNPSAPPDRAVFSGTAGAFTASTCGKISAFAMPCASLCRVPSG